MPRPLARPARGMSLVELLVGMIIALIVLGIALQLMLIARARYQRLADAALIEDRGMQALELIGSVVRQAGWITDTPSSSPVRRWPDAGTEPSLFGRDRCSSTGMLFMQDCRGTSEGNSDALLTRFAGRSNQIEGSDSDNATLDCGGYGVPERIKGDDDPRAGRILLYISRSSDSEETPQLMCLSLARNANTPSSGRPNGIVRGIETLQLLYTLASTSTLPAATVSARAMTTGDWSRVRQVHVAIVVRGDRYSMRSPSSNKIDLFPGLSDVQGAQAEDLEFQPKEPQRNRARFTATFAVRNPLRCEADAC